MSIRVILLTIVSIFCLAGRAYVQNLPAANNPQKAVAETIRLGPELLSFPEIAERLSTPDQPIRCSRALQQRAALVYLKDRTRIQARDILSRGLGVAFVPTDDLKNGKRTVLILQADRKIERREARWRQVFERNVSSLFQRRDQRRRALSQMNPAEFKAQHDALTAEFNKLYEANAGDGPDVLILIDRRNAYYGVLTDSLQDLSGLQEEIPTTRVGALWYQQNAGWLSVTDAMQQGFQYRVMSVDALPGLTKTDIDKIAARVGGTGDHGYDTLVGGMSYVRGSSGVAIGAGVRLVSLRHSFSAPCEVPYMNIVMPHDLRPPVDSTATAATSTKTPIPLESRLTDDIFLGMTQLAQPFEGLGKDAADWLSNERKETLAFLAAEEERVKKAQSEVRDQKDTVRTPATPLDMPIDTNSALLWKWATTNDREVIMELSPLAEADWWPKGDSLRAIFPPGRGWTLREEAGVLLVQNQLAFLDHARNVPTAALAVLVRHIRERRKQQAAANSVTENISAIGSFVTPTVDELLDYGRQAVGTVAWGEGIPFHFWGVSLPKLDASVPGAYLWGRMSTSERFTLQKEGRFPLAKLDSSVLQSIVPMFLAYPERNAQWFRPDAITLLKQCYLTPDLHIVPSQPGIRLFFDEAPVRPTVSVPTVKP